MTTAAVMLVRDEADIIGPVLDHLAAEVDAIIVADNGSTDGTREILDRHPSVLLIDDDEVAYYQSAKTTRLAQLAREEGHAWVIPCDADEIWTADDGRTLSRFLAGVALDAQVVEATLYNYVPTGQDDPTIADPTRRLRWRMPEAGALPKVCARTHPELKIHAGNHGADYGGAPYGTAAGLRVSHFTWRSEEQYLRKIRNGLEAYGATDLPERLGVHWRMWEGHDDETIRAHFREWFYVADPEASDLVCDPLPR